MPTSAANTLVVLDFETTGLSPNQGDRAIEIGAVLIENGVITQRFSELMNPGFRISRFIEDYTGISNQMLRDAAPCNEVMARFADFIADHNLVAHNAAFDQRFLDAEFAQIRHRYLGQFGCSLLVARRLYQAAPNHQLGTLVRYKQLPSDGTFHRALADAEMTGHLWLAMLADLQQEFGLNAPTFELLQKIAKKTKADVPKFLRQYAVK
ncbi:MAG: 3'-5' exonuclease [Shewanella sp.]|jgi:DNA polymerase-3 subunit epsilon|uniref:3'-5' exonuclease n=1 Tax=unclassified Shewanella TaxID=196818 RepID=UPI0015683328|nr:MULTISPECIES: 3'-5' exonuclease [unclassified Shewanella]MBW3513298.1 3'-5' exonuclease [Shewanella sp. NKUCC01_JLK]MCU8010804.1 3'-5' exonuclease [Shewanella sp. SM74]MCU8033537.1 3'-5' exonuclease [Shewanella sp. SM71]MCU8095460.1 3'-5' exonuclease [Shewanella sp. SM102]